MKRNVAVILAVVLLSVCITVFVQNYLKKEQVDTNPVQVYSISENAVIKTIKTEYESIGAFDLVKEFDDGYYAKFVIVPRNGGDEAQIYLKNSKENGWQVIAGPATSFPELDKNYPELKGR